MPSCLAIWAFGRPSTAASRTASSLNSRVYSLRGLRSMEHPLAENYPPLDVSTERGHDQTDPLRSQGNKRSGHWPRTLLALIQAEDLSVHAGNGIHNDRNCLPQRQTASVGTFIVSKANDGELVRRDNQDGLSAGAGHVERFFRSEEHTSELQSRPHL